MTKTKATLIINQLAQDYLSQSSESNGGKDIETIINQLSQQLIEQGEEPNHKRLILAGNQEQGFYELNDWQIQDRGVFRKLKGERFNYQGITVMTTLAIDKSTLVVAVDSETAEIWRHELEQGRYELRRC